MIVLLDMLRVALPVFVSVTVCGVVVEAMFSWPNARLAGERLMVVAGTIPVPVRLTACGLPLALSVMVSEALREPAAEGVNVTIMVQLPPAPTPLPQLFVWAKSPAFAPLSAILDIFREVLPVFVRVTLCAALVVPVLSWVNVRLLGARPTTGWSPVPLRLIVCGLPLALSLMVSEALRDPAAAGVNVTLMVQLVSAPTLLPQLLDCAKSPEFVPLRAMLDMLSDALPVFESVTICGALVEPMFCWPNARLADEMLTAGEKPLPSPRGPEQATQIPTASIEAARSRHAGRRFLASISSIDTTESPARIQGQPVGRRRPAGS